VLLRRLLSRRGFTAEQRKSLLRQVRERGSIYLAQINAVYVRQFQMTSAAEDATRFLHQACRGLPSLRHAKPATTAQALDRDDAFFEAVLEHALAFFGSRILHPARPALRDGDVAELYEVTREDLEQQTALPFADAVGVLDFVTEHRAQNFQCTSAPAFSGDKYEFVVEQLGHLTGTDLYDAYIEGRLTTAGLRKFFLTHIEQPGVAREAYVQLRKRLR